MPAQTPSQTVGPYFSMKLEAVNELAGPDAAGQRIRIEGTLLDGDRRHIEDGLIELWQADASGRYLHPADRRPEPLRAGAFIGYGRAHTRFETGEYWFETIKPGRVPDPRGALQAPHVNLIVTARGMLNHSYTRLYFSDEAAANREDLVLSGVPEDRRPTLIAERIEGRELPTYRFDIKFQRDDETVFFDI